MSHFLERLTYLSRRREPFAEGPATLAARQDRTLDTWRELHGWMQLEDLCQERCRYLGNATDRLSAYAPGHAEP
jgi:hypothetical protein